MEDNKHVHSSVIYMMLGNELFMLIYSLFLQNLSMEALKLFYINGNLCIANTCGVLRSCYFCFFHFFSMKHALLKCSMCSTAGTVFHDLVKMNL